MSDTRAPSPPRWRLDQLYESLDDRDFHADTEKLASDLARATAWFNANDVAEQPPRPTSPADVATASEAISLLNAIGGTQRRVRAYVHALTTTDARDDAAAAAHSRLLPLSGDVLRLQGRLVAWIGALEGDLPDAATAGSADSKHVAVVDGHREFLRQASILAGHRMSDEQEDLALSLGLTGSSAWVRLRSEVAGRLTADVEGIVDPVPMAVVRGFATDPDCDLRDRAFAAELDMWERNAVPFAAALNAHKGESITLNDRRGWIDDLEPVLVENGIDRGVLDAMTAEVVASLSAFRRFCAAKAELIGREDGLHWADLVAPVGDPAANTVSWADATERVKETFAGFSPALRRLADTAFDDGWIDAESRDGKQIGAYCMPVEGGVSRIMMNFDGSTDSVQTLAHELGHAFHNEALGTRTELQRRTPRSLAETASIFCETIVVESLLAEADPAQELVLLNTDLSGSNQVVVDIHSRYLFEHELYTRRRNTTLSIGELNELMVECQDVAYGDGLAPGSRHPYMWAVKGHYFTPFYNFPYTFGLLFGLGLYGRFEADPSGFRSGYDDLLSSTGMDHPVSLAARFGIDLADPAFWRSSLAVLETRIDRFVELAAPAGV